MRPRDTSKKIYLAQLAAFRRMPREQRLELALSMSDELSSTLADGVRLRHPSYDRATVHAAVMRLRLGARDYAKAFPQGPPLVV